MLFPIELRTLPYTHFLDKSAGNTQYVDGQPALAQADREISMQKQFAISEKNLYINTYYIEQEI